MTVRSYLANVINKNQRLVKYVEELKYKNQMRKIDNLAKVT